MKSATLLSSMYTGIVLGTTAGLAAVFESLPGLVLLVIIFFVSGAINWLVLRMRRSSVVLLIGPSVVLLPGKAHPVGQRADNISPMPHVGQSRAGALPKCSPRRVTGRAPLVLSSTWNGGKSCRRVERE